MILPLVSGKAKKGSGVQPATIEQIATAELVPYAHSVGRSKRWAATTHGGSQHGDIVEKRKWRRVRQKISSCEQPSMEHVVMIRAQRHKVRQVASAAVLYADDVMDCCCMFKSTQNTFSAVSNSCCILAGSVARFRDSSERTAVRFLSAFIGAESTLLTSTKSRRSDSNRVAANFARDGMAIVERMLFSGSRASKRITTIARAIDAIRQIRSDVEHVTAMLTSYFGRSLPSSSAIVA